MPQSVVTGAICKCSFGTAPCTLNFLPTHRTTSGAGACGNILDNIPGLNVPGFVMCRSLSNPVVAAATAAALGNLTPMPCIPAPAGPWIVGAPTTLLGGAPALTNTSILLCAHAGVITINFPGQVTVSAT